MGVVLANISCFAGGTGSCPRMGIELAHDSLSTPELLIISGNIG